MSFLCGLCTCYILQTFFSVSYFLMRSILAITHSMPVCVLIQTLSNTMEDIYRLQVHTQASSSPQMAHIIIWIRLWSFCQPVDGFFNPCLSAVSPSQTKPLYSKPIALLIHPFFHALMPINRTNQQTQKQTGVGAQRLGRQ